MTSFGQLRAAVVLRVGGGREQGEYEGEHDMHAEIFSRHATLRRDLENLVIEMGDLAREHLGASCRNREAALSWLERADIVSHVVDSIPVSAGEPIGRCP